MKAAFSAPNISSYGALVDRACPMCAGLWSRPILRDQYYAHAPDDVMAVVECSDCRFLFTTPIPSSEWDERYRDCDRSWGGDGGWMTLGWQETHERERFDDGLPIIAALARGKALVDVGCGPGLFVDLACAAGFNAIGVDTYPSTAAAANRRIRHMPVSALPSNSFDIVTLWCVVAHEPDFLGLLRDCYTVLRPGGAVFIETPNMTLWRWLRSLRALTEYVGLRPVCHDALGAYGHINHFTDRSLKTALATVGFTDVEFHLIRNHQRARGIVDRTKRALFQLSAGAINLSFPLVASASKR
jgi:2-polyprenyl-3-methyl-5-hydroxy-6-metoxy-1,4-benzoquinol methylase